MVNEICLWTYQTVQQRKKKWKLSSLQQKLLHLKRERKRVVVWSHVANCRSFSMLNPINYHVHCGWNEIKYIINVYVTGFAAYNQHLNTSLSF